MVNMLIFEGVAVLNISYSKSQMEQITTDINTATNRQISLTFDDNFLYQHAGRIVTDAQYALVELVANAWDAGADEVKIEYSPMDSALMSISDNGTGMTRDEFIYRWSKLSYNRLAEQGLKAEFPKGTRNRERTVFGKNGIGRHAMFCFADEYTVETTKELKTSLFRVCKNAGGQPFSIEPISEVSASKSKHGTKISASMSEDKRKAIDEQKIIELIGSHFIADPEFKVYVNNHLVSMTEIEHLSRLIEVSVENIGIFELRRFEVGAGKVAKQHGVAWWVNKRLVGKPTWDSLNGRLLDGRAAIAKKYTYVVKSDILAEHVKADWSGFRANESTNIVQEHVYQAIADDLTYLMLDTRQERSREVIKKNKEIVRSLPKISRDEVKQFVEDVQVQCPTIGIKELDATVKVFTNMEKARSGYALLEKLASLQPHDIDGLTSILQEWSVADAKKVLNELRYRLELIKKLESLVESDNADELHDLQPLFERGLWIFGPEFESIHFTSNLSLATVVEKFFGEGTITTPRKRPDFVIRPDSSIGIYASDQYDETHEVSGFDKIVIIELKRGGFEITEEEKDQVLRYARQLRKSGKAGKDTKIVCYVLGTTVANDVEELTDGGIHIIPRTYNTVLRQAHARTFHLLKKVKDLQTAVREDSEIDAILESEQEDMF